MKSPARILTGIIILTTLWSCSKNENATGNITLKQSFVQGSASLNTAVSTITNSRLYSIFTMSDATARSTADSIYRVYIPLSKISGVYEYKPIRKFDKWGMSLIQFFKRTADDSKMVVRMPLSKIEKPHSLRHYTPSDSTLANNFEIAVSDYHNNYNSFRDYDYILNSVISIDNKIAGNLNIKTIISPKNGTDYTSQYAFADGYTADYKYLSGDTTVSSFSISGSGKVLYEEKLLTIKNDKAKFGREHTYILTIGDVQIVRKSKNGTPQVYVKGVLQTGAKVTIVDKEADSEASVCKKRDVQITFEDGTTTTISALIGKSIDNIKTIFDSLHSVFFAAYIVDWIAYDIYYERN